MTEYKTPSSKSFVQKVFGLGTYATIFAQLDGVYGKLYRLYNPDLTAIPKGAFVATMLNPKKHSANEHRGTLDDIEKSINKADTENQKAKNGNTKSANTEKIKYLRLFLKVLRAWDAKQWNEYETLILEKRGVNSKSVSRLSTNTKEQSKGGVEIALQRMKEIIDKAKENANAKRMGDAMAAKMIAEAKYPIIRNKIVTAMKTAIPLQKRLASVSGKAFVFTDNEFDSYVLQVLKELKLEKDYPTPETRKIFVEKLKTDPEINTILFGASTGAGAGVTTGTGTGLQGGRRQKTRSKKGKGKRKSQTKKRNH